MSETEEFEQYKKGVESALKDFALMQNDCNANGYTFEEYTRISQTVIDVDFAVRIGQADAEIKGYSDAFESASIKLYAERGETNKIDNAVFTKLFEKYASQITEIQFDGMEKITRYVN